MTLWGNLIGVGPITPSRSYWGGGSSMAGGDYGAGALVTGINNIVQHFAAKKAARKEWKHFQHRYQIMRQDLERAGLNPMLAFGQPAYAPPSGEAGVTPMDTPDIAGAVASAKDQYRRGKLFEQELRQASAAADTAETTADVAKKWLDKETGARVEESYQRAGQSNALRWLADAQLDMTEAQRKWFEINAPKEAQILGNRAFMSDYETAVQKSLGEAGPWLRFLVNAGSVINRGKMATAPQGAKAGSYKYRSVR